MNVSIIRYILGHIIKLEGFFMLLPCVIALVFHEKELFTYLAMSVVCILLGSLLTLKKAKDTVFYLKEGCVATSLSWIFLSFFLLTKSSSYPSGGVFGCPSSLS